jgi:hypothetical protein
MLDEVKMAEARTEILHDCDEWFGPSKARRGRPSLYGMDACRTIAIVFMSIVTCDLDMDAAAELSGYSRRTVGRVWDLAKAKGTVDEDGKTIMTGGDWADPEKGALSFILDMMVLAGVLTYTRPNEKLPEGGYAKI